MLLLLLAAATASVPPDLSAAVAAYDRAQVDSDKAELERWLADDYLLIGPGACTSNQ